MTTTTALVPYVDQTAVAFRQRSHENETLKSSVEALNRLNANHEIADLSAIFQENVLRDSFDAHRRALEIENVILRRNGVTPSEVRDPLSMCSAPIRRKVYQFLTTEDHRALMCTCSQRNYENSITHASTPIRYFSKFENWHWRTAVGGTLVEFLTDADMDHFAKTCKIAKQAMVHPLKERADQLIGKRLTYLFGAVFL